jgi:hypothetical protein
VDEKVLNDRIEVLLRIPWDHSKMSALSSELLQGATSVMEAVYGTGSTQIQSLSERVAAIERKEGVMMRASLATFEVAKGALKNVKSDLESGLIGSLNRTITGEVLSDFLQLAKAMLDQGDENGKNVAAVLAAAAFEDTIRRMGLTFCGILTRDDLEGIVVALKSKGILVGSQFGTVQAQLQFRNDALHADWAKVDVVGVRTVLQLIQELLLKHF